MIGVLDAAYLGVWVVWKSCMMVAGVVKANFNIRSLPLPPPLEKPCSLKSLLPLKTLVPQPGTNIFWSFCGLLWEVS